MRAIFRGAHLYKDWVVELLRALQVRFHHIFPPRKDIRILDTACGRLRKESIDHCHLSDAYGSSKLELGRCSDLRVIFFISPGSRSDSLWSSPTRVVD